ncbi:DUF1003 domain-containing protein [Candidatus Woesearchaeota archaeon]|nr:DUF1003 domain-containing protein [Candidatus Woesearchaeota archaeon]MBW3021575.1 DUF1003 domain-containing protein [Candidatus Woesearchaeota archaeon]
MVKKKRVKKPSSKNKKNIKKVIKNNKNNKKNNKTIIKKNKNDKNNKIDKKKKNGFPKQRLTRAQTLADWLTLFAGSWKFIIGFFVFLGVWMLLNVYMIVNAWDSYPFILLNLVLSCLAAVQAPVILMSQNRAAERDRHKAELDYVVNRKAEREVANMQKDLDDIKSMIKFVHKVHKDKHRHK